MPSSDDNLAFPAAKIDVEKQRLAAMLDSPELEAVVTEAEVRAELEKLKAEAAPLIVEAEAMVKSNIHPSLDVGIRILRPATEEELAAQGASLAANYKPGPRNAIPLNSAGDDGSITEVKLSSQGQRAATLAQFPSLNPALIPRINVPAPPAATFVTVLTHIDSFGRQQACHVLRDGGDICKFMRATYRDFIPHETEPFWSCCMDKVYVARCAIL